MNEPQHENSRQAFEHACRRCARTFSPRLDLEEYKVLTAFCPHCGFTHGYDNRDGKIFKLLAAKSERLRESQSKSDSLETNQTPSSEILKRQYDFLPPLAQNSTLESTQGVFSAQEEPAEPNTDHTTAQAAGVNYLEPEYKVAHETSAETSPTKTSQRSWLASCVAKVGYLKNWRESLSWKKTVFSAATVLFVFIAFIATMQAIPLDSENAREAILALKARQADAVFDRNGREINRLGVTQSEKSNLADFHKWQLDALLFSEDRGFYEHHGVEYSAILRAFVQNFVRLRYAQGASTITQQLARIISQNRKKSIFRKMNEIRLARALEIVLSKQKILELYVNNVYLGHGNYSFASAARFYYNKEIRNLTPNEYLSIVALIPSPERFSPLKNNKRLLARMQALYESMRTAQILQVSNDDWLRGMDSVIEQGERFGSETAFGEKSRTGLWPAQFAREFLLQRKLLQSENQNSSRVYTTIDLDLQERAERLLQKHLANARKNYRAVLKSEDSKEMRLKEKMRGALFDAGLLVDLAGLPVKKSAEPQLQAALIAMAPRTGEILAMVGGDSFETKNQLNRTIQMRRQTGSAIKPFIYAKALSQHLVHAATLVDDSPYVVGHGSRVWAPENINGGFEGPIPVRDALAKSRNIPAIRVGKLIGREGVTELFSEFFFQNEATLGDRFRYDETVAIGTISLSPLEMARAFSVFANNGFLNDPLLITRVEAHEKVIDMRKTHADQLGLSPAPKNRLLSQAENALMVSLLKSSGRSAATGLGDIIGKTGTTSDSRDLWFVGGGREMIVAVWFGFDDMRYSIPGATGSAIAAKLAGDFLKKDFVPLAFKLQPGMVRLRICPLSGRLASDGCSHARSEVFLNGVMPEGECLHGQEAAENETDFVAVMGETQFH